MTPSPLAGKPAPPSLLVNVPRLVTAYYTDVQGLWAGLWRSELFNQAKLSSTLA